MSWPVLLVLGVLVAGIIVLLVVKRPTVVAQPPTEAHATALESDVTRLQYPGSMPVSGLHTGLRLAGFGGVERTSFCADAEPEQVRTWFRDWLRVMAGSPIRS